MDAVEDLLLRTCRLCTVFFLVEERFLRYVSAAWVCVYECVFFGEQKFFTKFTFIVVLLCVCVSSSSKF